MRGRDTFGAWILAAMPGTQAQIADRAGVAATSVRRWVNFLRETNEVHIMTWVPQAHGHGKFCPVHMRGPGADATCKIKPLTRKQIVDRYWARARANGRYEELQAQFKARRWANKARTTGDPLVNALFGARGVAA